jgi:hypothetical protein
MLLREKKYARLIPRALKFSPKQHNLEKYIHTYNLELYNCVKNVCSALQSWLAMSIFLWFVMSPCNAYNNDARSHLSKSKNTNP